MVQIGVDAFMVDASEPEVAAPDVAEPEVAAVPSTDASEDPLAQGTMAAQAKEITVQVVDKASESARQARERIANEDTGPTKADKGDGAAGQASGKSSQFAEQAKVARSKVNKGKAMGVTSRFMACVFKCGKIVSALFMLLCIVVMVLSVLYVLFKREESNQVPTFEDVVAAVESSENGQDSEAAELKRNQEYRKVRDRYIRQVDTIVDLYRLDAKDDTEKLLEALCVLPEGFRSTFAKGAISFGKDARKYYAKKDNGAQVDKDDLDLYSYLFEQAKGRAAGREMENRLERQVAWMVFGGTFLGLIMFMFLPLLIQIEENTRE